jgi:hypothetical protein
MTYDSRGASSVFRVALAALFGLSIAMPATAGVPMTGLGVGSLALGTSLVTDAKAKYKVSKKIHVNKKIKLNKNLYVTKNIKINKNVYVSKKVYVKNWSHKSYYGNVIAGVALGTILGVTAVGVVPAAPAPDLCWYWTNVSKNRGYWDYCF